MDAPDTSLVYDIDDKPPMSECLMFAFQMFIAILAGVILVPTLVNNACGEEILSPSAALIGAGFGTLVYQVITKFKSPVFLGGGAEFLPTLMGALAFGSFGLIVGSAIVCVVYAIVALLVRNHGSGLVDKFMPPIILGPMVMVIGLVLANAAILGLGQPHEHVGILLGLFTFLVAVFVSVKGGRPSLFPFLIAMFIGYVMALVLTVIGNVLDVKELVLVDFSAFEKITDLSLWVPNIALDDMLRGDFSQAGDFNTWIELIILFVPITIITMAEHITVHKNLNEITGKDLLKDPGLNKTLLGNGLSSMFGALICGIPNVTYCQTVSCIALTRNASVRTITYVAFLCILCAFFYPLMVLIDSIPSSVISGVAISLYGYIVVMGISTLKDIDVQLPRNSYVISAILITGVGGLVLSIATDNGMIEIGALACALITGWVTNYLVNKVDPEVPDIKENDDG